MLAPLCFCKTEFVSLCSSLSLLLVYPFLFQSQAIVGILNEDTDPLVNIMRVEKAPPESYADVGGLQQQIQEIKVCYRFAFIYNL